MASVALVTSSMSPVDGTYDGMAGASAPTSRRCRRRRSSSNKQKQHHTVQAARWLVALLLVIGPIPKQLPPPRAARAAQSYLVRPEAICAPAFIDPSKVARRARLV